MLTTFVKDSPIARLIKDNLAGRHMEYEGKEVPQGGPWGYRHQINIADAGSVKDFDLEKLFVKDGVQILHLSGLIAALSPETGTFCLELARAAKKHGTRIAFDLNYRATFWKDREKELRDIFTEIASVTDILLGNEEDFQLSLGIEGPEAGGKDIGSKIDSFKGMIGRVKAAFPNASVFATTLREVISTNSHWWGPSCMKVTIGILHSPVKFRSWIVSVAVMGLLVECSIPFSEAGSLKSGYNSVGQRVQWQQPSSQTMCNLLMKIRSGASGKGTPGFSVKSIAMK